MRKLMIASLLLCIATSAAAQLGPPGPPHGAPVPSALDIAAIPDLSADQQAGVRKLLLQRRDAIEALLTRQRADADALRQKERNERERIDDTTASSLRTLLGDNGMRSFAEWHAAQQHRPGRGPGMSHDPLGPAHDPRGSMPRDGSRGSAPTDDNE